MNEEKYSSENISSPNEFSGRFVNCGTRDGVNRSTHSNFSENADDTFQTVLARTRRTTFNQHDPNVDLKSLFSATATSKDIWMMGLVIVLGGQMYGWNTSLSSGFGTYATAQIMIGIAYVILVFCLAEISSAVAFSGGSYGLGRVVLGFYPGFLLGTLEMVEYAMMTSSSLTYISTMIMGRDFLDYNANCQPLVWLFILVVCMYLCVINRRRTWNVGMLLAIYSLLLILVYCVFSLPNVSFLKYAPLYDTGNDDVVTSMANYSMISNYSLSQVLAGQSSIHKSGLWFVGGMRGFMGILPYCTWAYAGVESLTLLTSESVSPIESIPKGMIAAVLTLFTTNIFLVFVASSLPPGLSDTQSADFVMNAGLHYIFKCSDMVSSTLILPGQFAMAWGFVLPCAKLIHSMAQSNLMPSILHLRDTKTHVPSMIAGCTLSFLFCGLGLAVPEFAAVSQNIAILSATITYIAQLFCYYMLRTKFSSVEREFRSPVGIPGAVCSGLAFILCFIATAFFQDDGYVAFYSLLIIVATCSAYYYLFARNTQIFSKDEHGTVFRLHVINYNTNKQRRKGRSHIMFMKRTVAYAPSFLKGVRSNVARPSIGIQLSPGKIVRVRPVQIQSFREEGLRSRSEPGMGSGLKESEMSNRARVIVPGSSNV